MKLRSTIALFTLLIASAACGDDVGTTPDAGTDGGRTDTGPVDGGSPPRVFSISHTANAPFTARSTGPVAFVDDQVALAATPSGIAPIALAGAQIGETPDGWPTEWALTSTTGPASVAGVAVAPASAGTGGPVAFFLPGMRPQVGALRSEPSGPLLSEAVLSDDLGSPFPSAIVAPARGVAADALWVVDAVFGPGGAVRAYPYAGFDGTSMLTQAAGRRFTPAARDLDGNAPDETPVLAKLAFSDDGTVGVVSWSVAGNTAIGGAGGIDAFDPADGTPLGSVAVPNADTATTTLGFIGSVALSGDRLVAIVAEKGPSFEEVGGQLAVYDIASFAPFEVIDADPGAPFDQPGFQLRTSIPNPVGLWVGGDVALVVCAPFGQDAVVDIFDLGAAPALRRSIALGSVVVTFQLPSDPVISPDGTTILIGSESGLLRLEVTEE